MALAVSVSSVVSVAQSAAPLSKSDLIDFLKQASSKGLNDKQTTARFVVIVNRRGVDFQMSSKDEADLRAEGARPELITAVRKSYRASGAGPGAGSKDRKPRTNAAYPPTSGPPVSHADILGWLRRGIPSSHLERVVRGRKADFVIQPQQREAIIAFGGTEELARVIGNSPTRAAVEIEYDNLLDQAGNEIADKRYRAADQLIHRALELDPAPARAYSLHGTVKLYGDRDFAAAEREMREALSRNGEVYFYVIHDCSDRRCEGALKISKYTVVYEPEGGHPFSVGDHQIKDAAVNPIKLADVGGFHIRLPNKNYNFTPNTRDWRESELIVKLIYLY
jgi:hypothetical protein